MAPAAVSPAVTGRSQKDPRPIPAVPDINSESYTSEDALVEDIIAGLKRAGFCIIRQIIKPDVRAKISAEFRPYTTNLAPTPGDFWPKETRKILSMVSKSETYALEMVGHPVWQRVGEHFMTSTLKDYWNSEEITTAISKPQLNNTQGFIIGPGARDQGLHRDDFVHHNHQPYAEKHHLGRDTSIAFFLAETPTNHRNGATRFIPGSHLWDYDILPDESLAVQPELQPGDGVMMLSGTYHGGSKNQTDESRAVWSAVTTRGYLRQEENQYLCNDVEKIKKLPIWLQRFCGYEMSKPFMGYVELDDPIKVLHPDFKTDGVVLY